MTQHQIQLAKDQFGIDSWGSGYFGMNESGHVTAHPFGKENGKASLHEITCEAAKLGMSAPLIIRFPQIISQQLGRMHEAFREAMFEFNYPGKHCGAFPFKVNQRREFIDAIVKCGTEFNWGLEVGSKTEFMAALSYELPENALLICNGFKDRSFIELAFIAASEMGRKIVIVSEGPDELDFFADELAKGIYKNTPMVGVRVRLSSKGSGKWQKSSGETSKFGLTTIELMQALSLIEKRGLKDHFKMLHFHIGSQVTAIKRFKNAIKEAARVYAKVCKMDFSPSYLNIGGGVGVDYDGSQSSAESSANYTLKEFANDAIYVIGEVCKAEDVKCPNIVTESGRVIAAHHSVVVSDIREIQ